MYREFTATLTVQRYGTQLLSITGWVTTSTAVLAQGTLCAKTFLEAVFMSGKAGMFNRVMI